MALHPVHALSAAELTTARTRIPAQFTRLRLAVWPKIPDAVVWEARVTLPLPTSNDMVYEIDFDGGGANFADTIADMTVWIGTTSRSYDRGIVRLRSAAPGVAGTLEIGETSEIVWADDLYITVIDDFGLWPRHVYLNPAGVIFMDRDIAYTDQHEYPDPIPILLSDEVVEYDGVLGGVNTVDVLFDANDSWTLDGGALTYSWVAPGASATAGMATATPTVTYDAAGTFRVGCTVSRDYGGGNISTFTGYRYVHIFDDNNLPDTTFYLDSCSGSFSSGGWSFSITMEDGARRSEVVDRAKVILFAEDRNSLGPIYSDTHGLLRTKVLAVGWIAGETIHFNNQKGTVEFEVRGPQFWFDQMPAFPHGIEDYDGSPTSWQEFEDLDVRGGDWSWLRWRTTAPRMMDCYVPLADARQIRQFPMPGSSTLWDQLSRTNEQTILATPVCDRYGRLWIRRPLSLLFTAERAGIVTVMDITKADWREQVDIQRRVVDDIATLDASGVGYLNATADPYYMLVLGHIYKRYGGVDSMEKLALFQNQATNNLLAGLVFSYRNNPYPSVDIRMAGYYRVMDVVPPQRLTMSIADTDTERGIEWIDKTLVPTSVTFTHDSRAGVLEVDLTCEAETFGVVGITGDPPPTLPPTPTSPPAPYSPPVEPPPPPSNYGVAVACQDQMAISFNFFDQLSPDWYNLDPNADLIGDIQNLVIGSNYEAYCTTRDDTDMTNTGVWYCSDVTDAVTGTNSWSLLIPADGASPSGTADTGYNNGLQKCCFGSIFINQSNVCCAVVHGAGNAPPPVGQSGYYKITAGVPAFSAIPNFGGQPGYVQQPADRTIFNVYGWDGNFFLSVRSANVGDRSIIYEDGVGTKLDFDPPDTRHPVGINNGWFRSWTTIAVPPNSNLFGGGAWNSNSESIVTENGGFGVVTDWQGLNNTYYLYQLGTASVYDLYSSVSGQIGDASVEFGGTILGGLAAIYPLDTDQIVWVAGSTAAFATRNVVVYTDDEGATWVSKDGAGATSLQTALGGAANWSGWSTVTIANSIARIFAY